MDREPQEDVALLAVRPDDGAQLFVRKDTSCYVTLGRHVYGGRSVESWLGRGGWKGPEEPLIYEPDMEAVAKRGDPDAPVAVAPLLFTKRHKFSPDQPRDETGRWSDDGGGASVSGGGGTLLTGAAAAMALGKKYPKVEFVNMRKIAHPEVATETYKAIDDVLTAFPDLANHIDIIGVGASPDYEQATLMNRPFASTATPNETRGHEGEPNTMILDDQWFAQPGKTIAYAREAGKAKGLQGVGSIVKHEMGHAYFASEMTGQQRAEYAKWYVDHRSEIVAKVTPYAQIESENPEEYRVHPNAGGMAIEVHESFGEMFAAGMADPAQSPLIQDFATRFMKR